MKMFFRKAALSIVQGCFFITALCAAPHDFLFTSIDERVGLSDNCVNDVLFDSSHYLWIATNEGLDFYDGQNIVHLNLSNPDNDLPSIVFSLSEDANGTLWAGTSSGLFRILREDGAPSRFDAPEFNDVPVRYTAATENGFLWCIGKDGDLCCVNINNSQSLIFPSQVLAICNGPGNSIYAITKDSCLLCSNDGISEPERVSEVIDTALSGIKISRIVYAGDRLFLISSSDTPLVLDLSTLEISTLDSVYKMRDAIVHSSGEYWIAARDGICVFDKNLVKLNTVRPYHDNSFRCLVEGSCGEVWAGTMFEGLASLSPNRLDFRCFSNEFAGGGNFKVRDIVEDLQGRIWVASDKCGLLSFEPLKGENTASKQYFKSCNITALMAEGNDIWIGTIDDKLPVAKLNAETGKIVYYPDAGISSYAFCRDVDGRLWIGNQNGFVVGRDSDDGKFEREVFVPTSQVCSIILATDGSIWVATISGQVFRYNSMSFTTYWVPSTNILTDIIESNDGQILAASEGSGLWRFDETENCFVSTSSLDLHLLKMSKVQGEELLWVTGADGIQVLDARTQDLIIDIPTEALKIDRFNYSSNFIDSRGTLYAGTSDGFISFSVRKIVEESVLSDGPVISSFCVLSSTYTNNDYKIQPRVLELDRNSRSFRVNLSTLDYEQFPSKRILWKVDGLNEWTTVKNGSFNVYDIPAGRWELKLKEVTLSGEEGSECITELIVKPHILLSTIAFFIYFLILSVAFGLVVFFVNRRAKLKAKKYNERKLFEAKMDFLSSIAHEIRTPLTLVQVPLEALIQRFSTSPDSSVQENLDIIKRNSLKLTILINELLDFRKLTDSTFKIRPEFIDVRIIVRDAQRRFLPMFLQEGKSLAISVPDTPILCETDVRSFGRVLDNLLSNALKYSEYHTSISLSADGKDAIFLLENDGKIIPEHLREKVFQPFYRYDGNDSSKLEGTGLGLSTSVQFAAMIGGSLAMDRDMSINRFIFTIPLTVDTKAEELLPKVQKKDKCVMIVEDDKDMVRLISGILGETYDIITAFNGQEALDKIKAGASPSLIVSDVIMPVMDGVALIKDLKTNLGTSHIPVVLLSAEVPDTLMQESLENGADAYLEKPFSPKKLRKTVDNLIENRRRIYEFYVSSLPSDGPLPTGKVSEQEKKFLRSIQEYVNSNIHRNITVDELAEVVCLSSSSLYKKMKEYAGLSPMEYVMKVRLHRAVELLKDDSISVQEVALAVGFNTHSFFSECFKREFSMTPRQWRNRNVSKALNTK